MKKALCITLALLFTLALPACSKADSPDPAVSASAPSSIPAAFVPSSDSQREQSPSQGGTFANCTFNPTLFGGKLRSCAYAGNGTLLVQADKLYLYDTTTSSVLATAETPLRDFDVQIIDRGYILSGMGDDGMMVYIYDDSLSLHREISVDELLADDFTVSETGVAASTDGKKLAIAAMRGLYLYDLESGKLTALLDLTRNAGTSNIGVSMLYGLAFVQGNSQLAFYGGGTSIPAVNGEDNFSIYGSIAVDGSNLKLTKSSAYDIEEMQSRAGRLFCPQIFTKNNGTLLWIDRATGKVNTLSFATGEEGKDGVYSSEWGKYVATAVLAGNLTIRIYDVDSGKLIATKVIENANAAYFNRIPRIYLLGDAKTAVILLGGGINEIDTLVSTFEFGES